jgi:hypothetical protein
MTAVLEISQVLVTISTHPALEESLIDWLLERESGPGFTSYNIRGHSSKHDHLSIAEQVSGRQSRKRFEIEIDETACTSFVEGLEKAFRGADVHFWVTPILMSRNLSHS